MPPTRSFGTWIWHRGAAPGYPPPIPPAIPPPMPDTMPPDTHAHTHTRHTARDKKGQRGSENVEGWGNGGVPLRPSQMGAPRPRHNVGGLAQGGAQGTAPGYGKHSILRADTQNESRENKRTARSGKRHDATGAPVHTHRRGRTSSSTTTAGRRVHDFHDGSPRVLTRAQRRRGNGQRAGPGVIRILHHRTTEDT